MTSYPQSHTAEDHAVADLIQFLRFPSVSTDPKYKADTDQCADWLVMKLQGIGLTAEKHPTPGHPVVVARNAQPRGSPYGDDLRPLRRAARRSARPLEDASF